MVWLYYWSAFIISTPILLVFSNDNLDAFPNDPNETLDSDGDGYGDNEETEAGTDPNDADDQPIQSGLPIWLLYEASKS